MTLGRTYFAALASAAVLFSVPTIAEEIIEGPIMAEVLDVYDGDTITVRAKIWPGQSVETKVRILGIDTGERKNPACEAERLIGEKAKVTVENLLAKYTAVKLYGVKPDKYAGRVDARVVNRDGLDVGQMLLNKGYAKPYDGGTKPSWCK